MWDMFFRPYGAYGTFHEFLTHGLRHGLRSFARFAGYDAEQVSQRFGGEMLAYRYQHGALTFSWYDGGPSPPDRQIRMLIPGGQRVATKLVAEFAPFKLCGF